MRTYRLKYKSLIFFIHFVWVFFSGPETTENPDDDMFPITLLWALLFNRRELAEILWLRGKDHLCKITHYIYDFTFQKNKKPKYKKKNKTTE